MNKYFVIATTDKYPDGDAGAVRTDVFAKILIRLGYQPVVVGLGAYTGNEFQDNDGVMYRSLRYENDSAIMKVIMRLFYRVRLLLIINHLGIQNIGGFVFASGRKNVLKYLKRITKKYKLPLIYDAVEWYSPSEFKNGEKNYFYRQNNRINGKLIDDSIKVVSISSFFEDYFNSKNIKTVRIPAILDVSEIEYNTEKKENTVKLVYAGMPGPKDKLHEMLEAICQLKNEVRGRLKFTIVGISMEQYEAEYGKLDSDIDDIVSFKGRKSREETMNIVRGSDFAFLLRNNEERYAKAGFPTKVAESMSLGTAMLCNISSDLDKYLIDGDNCIVIDDCSVEACVRALQRVLTLSNEKIETMKSSARKCAETYFDCMQYADLIEELLKNN